VEAARSVALDDEDRLLAAVLAAERLGRLLAVAFALVLAEAHERVLPGRRGLHPESIGNTLFNSGLQILKSFST
jgi:hypothetical protein